MDAKARATPVQLPRACRTIKPSNLTLRQAQDERKFLAISANSMTTGINTHILNWIIDINKLMVQIKPLCKMFTQG